MNFLSIFNNNNDLFFNNDFASNTQVISSANASEAFISNNTATSNTVSSSSAVDSNYTAATKSKFYSSKLTNMNVKKNIREFKTFKLEI